MTRCSTKRNQFYGPLRAGAPSLQLGWLPIINIRDGKRNYGGRVFEKPPTALTRVPVTGSNRSNAPIDAW